MKYTEAQINQALRELHEVGYWALPPETRAICDYFDNGWHC